MNNFSQSTDRAKEWQLICFAMSRSITSIAVVLITFIGYVAAGGYGIAVAVAGTIASATRILDGVIDPFLAFVGDRLVTKYGRVRIIMSLGVMAMILSLMTIYFWGIGTNIIVYTVAYCFYIIGSSFFTVGLDTGNVIITKDPMQRRKIGQYAIVFTMVSSAIISVYNSNILVPKYGGLTLPALQDLCVFILIILSVMAVLSICAVSEKDTKENLSVGTSKISLKTYWKLVKENIPHRCFVISFCSTQITQQAASQAAVTTMVFGMIIGNYAFRGNLSLIELIPTLLLVFFSSKLKGGIDSKKNLIRWSSVCMAVAAIMVAFLALGDPREISVKAVPTAIFLIIDVLLVASRSVVSSVTDAMRPDISDYETYRSESFAPGMVSAVITFFNQVTTSLSTTIVSFCLVAIGYVTTMPQPNDPVTSPIFWMTMFLWMGLPFLGWLSTLIAVKFYSLDAKMMEEVQRVNRERKIQGQKN